GGLTTRSLLRKPGGRAPATAGAPKSTRARLAQRARKQPPESRPPAQASPPPPRTDGRVRISKLMADRGLCSRREADEFIERGWVLVDGERVTQLGARALPSQDITLDKRAAGVSRVTILLHKPIGYVSGQAEDGYTPAVALVTRATQHGDGRFAHEHLRGLAPAGRLDIDSTGLLVLTQDGRVARELIGDDSQIDEEYLVRVDGNVNEDGLKRLRHGLHLDGVALRPAEVTRLGGNQLRFVLREGRKL